MHDIKLSSGARCTFIPIFSLLLDGTFAAVFAFVAPLPVPVLFLFLFVLLVADSRDAMHDIKLSSGARCSFF
eukprot:1655428-Rhodomonas_salina.1